MDNIKVLIGELNGVELNIPREYILSLDTVVGVDLSGALPGQQIAWNGTQWELVTPAGSSLVVDYHSGWYHIIAGQQVPIDDNKQMNIVGTLTLEGLIVNNGQLVIL